MTLSNSEKKFSIVFPSRERTQLLNKMLTSILTTTKNHEKIEVLVAVDIDDKKTRAVIPSMRRTFPFLEFYLVKRSLNFSRDYYNFLSKRSTGKWIIAGNDDAVFETPRWDELAEETLEKYIGDGPNVVYGWSEDKLGSWRAKGHGNYCCFPLIGRDGYKSLGYFFPDRIPTWGADIWMRKIYDSARRTITLPITIAHYSHHNLTREQDHINKRIAQNQVQIKLEPSYTEINQLIAPLRLAARAKK